MSDGEPERRTDRPSDEKKTEHVRHNVFNGLLGRYGVTVDGGEIERDRQKERKRGIER